MTTSLEGLKQHSVLPARTNPAGLKDVGDKDEISGAGFRNVGRSLALVGGNLLTMSVVTIERGSTPRRH